MKHAFYMMLIALFISSCGGTPPSDTPAKIATQPSDTASTMAAPKVLTPLMEGKLLFARCKACHTINSGGKHMVGPNLYGTIGSPAASKSGFIYSKAMKASGLIWTDDTLSDYIANPAAFLPKNRMVFVGLRNQSDRDKLILYLKSQTVPGFVAPQPPLDPDANTDANTGANSDVNPDANPEASAN